MRQQSNVKQMKIALCPGFHLILNARFAVLFGVFSNVLSLTLGPKHKTHRPVKSVLWGIKLVFRHQNLQYSCQINKYSCHPVKFVSRGSES